jgi:hypothetical protein
MYSSLIMSFLHMLSVTQPHFLSLPLENQGCCPWSLVARGGLLISGNPAIGIIAYGGRYFSLVDVSAMRAFVADPMRFIDGVLSIARKKPALVHLLCLQNQIPHSDISDFFTLGELADGTQYGFSHVKRFKQTQTPHFINTDLPDPDYEWNEWTLRRNAIQMANLCSKRTRSTQTHLSHFRRDAETQVYLPHRNPDGTMAGVSCQTQTQVDRATQVRGTRRYLAGLRGRPTAHFHPVLLTFPETVTEASNPPLNAGAAGGSAQDGVRFNDEQSGVQYNEGDNDGDEPSARTPADEYDTEDIDVNHNDAN